MYAPGDRIFLIGFSRGAFQAQPSGLIHTVGLLKSSATTIRARRSTSTGNSAQRAVTSKTCAAMSPRSAPIDADEIALFHDREQLRIHFLGVWDTVAGLGLPMWGWSFELFRINTQYHNTAVVPSVAHAFHAVAMDEFRSSFMPVLLKRPAGFTGKLEQKWFRGAHADVGGGYRDARLSDIALDWMMDKAEAAGLRFEPRHRLAPQADSLGSLHDEVARAQAYALAGLWPRMFPLSQALREQVRTLFGAAADDFEDVGEWHESVNARGARLVVGAG